MTTIKTLLIGALAIASLLTGCSSITVNADYDPATDFTSLKTFTWLPDEEAEDSDPRAGNQLVSARVTEALERELLARGYQRVDSGGDFAVGFSISVRHGVDSYSEPVYYGHYGSYGRYGRHGGYGVAYGSSTQVYEYEEGKLQVDFIEPVADHLVWRGTATSRLREGQSPEESTARINEVVAKLIAQFPPK